jgi:hypothetical protein
MVNEFKAKEISSLKSGMTLLKVNKKGLLNRFYFIDLVNYQLIGNSKDPKSKNKKKKCKFLQFSVP